MRRLLLLAVVGLACRGRVPERVVVVKAEVLAAHGQLGIPAPLPPTDISVTIKNRRGTDFEVCWTNPPAARGRQRVVSAEVSYARVPITPLIIGDAERVGKVKLDHKPTGPGQRDCQVVKTLNIETDYYFAVQVEGDGVTTDDPGKS